MYYIIVGILILVLIILLIEVVYYNKFQMARIRISEAENNIDILLQKKLALLERTVKIIEDFDPKYQEDQILSGLLKIKNRKLNNLESRLKEVESLNTINFDLIDIDNDLIAAKKYYNDTIISYNKLVKCFPSNFVALIFHYPRKEFYADEKVEIFEILKEK